jgi:Zn-dependent protease
MDEMPASVPPNDPQSFRPEPTGSFREPPPSIGQRLKKALGPVGLVLVLIVKFLGKLKFVLMPLLKFGWPVLKTGGTMLISIWAYAQAWGWQFAVGFVALIFVHESGHLVAARWLGLKVGAPVFIPFMGAFIALKEAPRNAWIEAQVGIGGPMAGALAAAVCEWIYLATQQPIFRGLAYTGFFLNLFNLAPIGFLDGGRIVTALSPWLWVIGLVVVGAMLFLQPNFLLVLILIMSLPRVWSLFRKKTDEEKRSFEVTPAQRVTMGLLYFGLVVFLVIAMAATRIEVSS